MMKMAEYTFTFQIDFGWGDVFETAVNTELPCGRPRSSSHLRSEGSRRVCARLRGPRHHGVGSWRGVRGGRIRSGVRDRSSWLGL